MTSYVNDRFMRDSQRSRVYRAERAAYDEMVSPQGGVTMTDVSCEAKYVARLLEILQSKYLTDMFGCVLKVPVKFSDRMRGAHASAVAGIRTGRNRYIMSELILIHELCHVLQQQKALNWSRQNPGQYDANPYRDPGHGRMYCELYLSMVSRFISVRAAEILRRHFKVNSVRCTPKRKTVPLTPEKLEALRAKLAAARTKRAPVTGNYFERAARSSSGRLFIPAGFERRVVVYRNGYVEAQEKLQSWGRERWYEFAYKARATVEDVDAMIEQSKQRRVK